ncbi:MAG: peptide ABC transporter substrate-binding protein [Deltaproteobacteria bacterium RIFCSPLOWO2_02_FULL_53_8]|nr:MAG: peptide ABC transporter substrate-binding protein [Deltaproteobacteria bacterium RIFCSPLOWO2_02_FULL_53_8]
MTHQALFAVVVCAVALTHAGCTPNNPYRDVEQTADIFYTTFSEPPKHLDPGRAYSSNEYDIIGQIYEPPLQYHYLRRPYVLVPGSAAQVPVPVYYSASGKRFGQGSVPAVEGVGRVVYEIKIKRGLGYSPHPAFAKTAQGRPVYDGLTKEALAGIDEVNDFPVKASREAVSDDFIYGIKRLADPQVESPILPVLEKYILGLSAYSAALKADLEEIRRNRKEAAGPAYNQDVDERENPIILDYDSHPLAGVERVDAYTYRIILKTKYPQFIYWLAMPFFAPIPAEVVSFYKQPALSGKNITLDRFPVGTGPYMMDAFNPNMEIALVKNPDFHEELYPSDGEAEDGQAGLLRDAGAVLPFAEKIVFKLEKEAIPRWNKFLQGYYDNSGISSDSFDQAVSMSASGRAELTESMKAKGITLSQSVLPSTYYGGFNMLDPIVGGYTPSKQKLRQAISIALDYEEYVEIFNNGRGIPASSPLPPEIFGYRQGRGGINPYLYRWDAGSGRARRLTIDDGRRLMAEAGYPDGRDKNGQPLVITFDNPMTGADSSPVINWYIKRLRLLGIQLENRTTDYNRFQEKMLKGNFQFFTWGWNADYPDPENFFFLLTSSNGKVRFQGENAANYSNPEFDRLFKIMENMDNSPERLRIIGKMTDIVQRDSPWVWGFHPVAFGLRHQWVGNVKQNSMASNSMKYVKLDVARRNELRRDWNKPNWLLFAAGVVFFAAVIAFGIGYAKRRAMR